MYHVDESFVKFVNNNIVQILPKTNVLIKKCTTPFYRVGTYRSIKCRFIRLLYTNITSIFINNYLIIYAVYRANICKPYLRPITEMVKQWDYTPKWTMPSILYWSSRYHCASVCARGGTIHHDTFPAIRIAILFFTFTIFFFSNDFHLGRKET